MSWTRLRIDPRRNGDCVGGLNLDVQAVAGIRSIQKATLGDPEVCVAVLDGPVDVAHPCFAGANIRRLDTLVRDPAGQGPMSVHGTHVASLIFGQPDSRVAGIAPRCRGLIAPVFQDFDERHLSQLDLARAIEQAVQEGAHVINISGGQQAPEGQAEGVLGRALRLCEDNNVLIVAAVGNDGCSCVHVPAAIPSVLGVGALSTDGKPLRTSNWGEAYRSNGILAPGENIRGAAPGGGTAFLTGSSFATPIVSGVAALLVSAQVQQGRPPDPRAVGKALLETALPCQPRDSPECRRYLVGTLNIPGAYASVTKGGRTVMASNNTTEAAYPAASSLTTEADTGAPETSGAGIAAAGCDCPAGVREAAAPAAAPGPPETGIAAASGSLPANPATPETTRSSASSSAVPPAAPPASTHPAVPARAPSGDVVPAGDCSCGGGGAKPSYIFAIGVIGFDFGTEARRDSFRQLMKRPQTGGDPPVSVPPNPYDVYQLADYLDDNKSESTKLIWTLNLDTTPIYAIEAEPAYAEDVYEVLRAVLRNQALPIDNENYVSRVAIPGVLTNRTRRLFSGQVVPVVIAQPRGLAYWRETALVDALIPEVTEMQPGATEQWARQTLRAFLDKVYYQLRNLGQSSPDRALNYAASNAFQFASSISQGLLSGQHVPGPPPVGGRQPQGHLYTLDTITVSKSPYCRMDSDCWDVQMKFFDPENDTRASNVFLYTIDVSDEMPVSLAPAHQFLVASR
jgi:cyanobactin maturation PatA/PatG family protease